MRNALARLSSLFRRFARNNRAVAAVEFAMILPVMLSLYIGSVELSSAITVDKRVATVSGSLGDLVARADGSITKSQIDDYFLASAATMAPYDDSNVGQIVSCVKVDADGNGTIEWSVSYNGATQHATDSEYDLPTDLKSLAINGYVIVSEAKLSYAPMFGYFFNTNFNLYHEFYFMPRFGEAIAYDPAA
jgi:Flp pilus assembly protein TadG